MSVSTIEKYGATPANIQWTVVRGDSATLKVEFFEDDEDTEYDTSDWTYSATAYESNGDILDELVTTGGDGYVEIFAPSTTTENWGGNKYSSIVAELKFDLQIVISGGSGQNADTVWTPVIGTISVLGDVSAGL